MNRCGVGVVLFIVVSVIVAHAQVPSLINYQGRLTDGTNLVNGTVALTLRLWSADAAGNLLYEDSNNVAVVDGLYSTFIGDDTVTGSLTAALTNATVFVEVAVHGAALAPRERLAAVGYAVLANDVPGNTFWRTEGNDGTTAGTHFIGTTDEQPLHLRANNATALRLDGEPNPPNLIGGHASNYADPGVNGAFIGGGGDPLGFFMNRVSDHYGVVGGGVYNVAGDGSGTVSNSSFATVAGGAQNSAASPYSAIGGGSVNQIFGAASHSVIAGGYNNIARGTNSAIGGGSLNEARGEASVVAGGSDNESRGRFSSIAGGAGNEATGSFSAVAGGYNNAANGDFSYAAGQSAQSLHHGTFVWADYSSFALFTSSDSNQFLIRAANGVGINTNGPFTDALTVGGGIRASEAIHAESFVGDGSGLTMLNGSNVNAGTVSNAAFAKGAVTGDKIRDGSISNADVAANTFWETDGNAGTTPGTHFLGTTDTQPVDLRVNNARALRLQPGSEPNVIGGYVENTADVGVVGATIGGGGGSGVGYNRVSDNYGTVGGGQGNRAGNSGGTISDAAYGTVGGGRGNANNAQYGTIAGGVDNTLSSLATGSFIGGGSNNVSEGSFSVIAGGRGNYARWPDTVVGGGYGNVASNTAAVVAGGEANTAYGAFSSICGGLGNDATSNGATVAGGIINAATGWTATVAGGGYNRAGGYAAAVGGGTSNMAMGARSVVAGGFNNRALGLYSSIGGGVTNSANSDAASIGGGAANFIGTNSPYASIAGGTRNTIQTNAEYASIGAGEGNRIEELAYHGRIGGGIQNLLLRNAYVSTIAGGNNNVISNNANQSFIGGGSFNTIGNAAAFAVVPGGAYNMAGASYTLAAGRRAKAMHEGAFVWADSEDADFASTTNNQFAIRATNGVWISSSLGGSRPLSRAGERYADNNVVAWGSITGAGAISDDFGITSVTRTNTGIYNIVIDAATVGSGQTICAVVTPEIDVPPTNFASLCVASVNIINSSNRFFQVFMNSGTGALTNNDFRVVVTLR